MPILGLEVSVIVGLVQPGDNLVGGNRARNHDGDARERIQRRILWSWLLCIVFAAERFHQYIYGRDVEVQSDHKPLDTITRTPLHNASPRLQLMLLRLLRYKPSIRCVQGSKMYIADTMSRAFLSTDSQPDHNMEMRIHSVSKYFPATPHKLQALKDASLNDDVQNQIRRYVMHGWPKYKDDASPQYYINMHIGESEMRSTVRMICSSRVGNS